MHDKTQLSKTSSPKTKTKTFGKVSRLKPLQTLQTGLESNNQCCSSWGHGLGIEVNFCVL